MQLFPDSKTVLSIGGLSITWYAVFIIIGALIAYKLSCNNLKKHHIDKETLSDLFVNILFIGVIGARIWYVVLMYDEIFKGQDILNVFKIWEGGLAIQGGVIAGLIYGAYFVKKHNIDFFIAADAIMPNVLVAQAIGRLGNFVNQEAFGSQVSRSFLEGLFLPDFIIEGMYINGSYYHPTFLYELIGNFMVFFIIVFIVKKFTHLNGVAFFSYFIGYGIIRFFVESLRTDSLMFLGLKMAQLTSIAFILFGIIGIGIIYFNNKNKKSISR